MKRLLRHLLFALLTFIIGVVLSPIRFYEAGIGCGRMPDGHGYSIRGYRSSYFVKLWVEHAGYSSAEKANEVFQRLVKEGIEVIERTPKFDREGQKVGERMVIISSPDQNGRYACVLWTDKTILNAICSSSLMHVLEFEKNQTDY